MSHIIRPLLTALIVPPPNLVLLAIVGLCLMRWRRRSRTGPVIVAASLAGLLILSLPVVGQALLISLEQGLPLMPSAGATPQAIVILSAELDHVRGADEPVRPGPLTLQRLQAGAALYRRTHLPVLVSGGTLRHQEPPIAAIMADSLNADFGVPVRWTEDRSRTTWENAADSAAILRPLGIRAIYVVTHAWHEKRAMLAFRHFGLLPTAAPVQLDAIGGGIWPSTVGWSRSYYALHEWVGYIWYWLHTHTVAPSPESPRDPALGSSPEGQLAKQAG